MCDIADIDHHREGRRGGLMFALRVLENHSVVEEAIKEIEKELNS